jgi:SAM-dependent methyltransferase
VADEFNSKNRFSSRVENYIKYRPKYPPEIISFLENDDILSQESVIADIGSGTGILSEIFLKNGNKVYAIEPNTEMRIAAERLLKTYPNFVSIDGSAEETGLKRNSIDIIIAGQAFHWFDQEKARKEFLNILKPTGQVALIWNRRKKAGTKFLGDYENLLSTYGIEYKKICNIKPNFDEFYGSETAFKRVVFGNYQELDYPSLEGRLLSSSYAPLKDHPNHEPMVKTLKAIYQKNQKNNKVTLEYDTEVYYGQLI